MNDLREYIEELIRVNEEAQNKILQFEQDKN